LFPFGVVVSIVVDETIFVKCLGVLFFRAPGLLKTKPRTFQHEVLVGFGF